MINFNYKDGYVYLFLKYVDLINWFSVVIIFKVIYVRFEKEKNYFMVLSRIFFKILFIRNMFWIVFMNILKLGWENVVEIWIIWGLCLLIRGMGEE